MVTPSQQWDYSRLVGNADSADFQGPIARPVSDDFYHFFTQIATEYDGDPIQTVADYSRLGGNADSADFQGPIAKIWHLKRNSAEKIIPQSNKPLSRKEMNR